MSEERKTPESITVWDSPDAVVRNSEHCEVALSYYDWCLCEVERMQAKGGNARIECHGSRIAIVGGAS